MTDISLDNIEYLKRSHIGYDWSSPSSSSGGGPARPCFGVFMKRGKTVLKPRMSTNFWQLSEPSLPVIAWFSTLMAQLRDSFFSLVCKEMHKGYRQQKRWLNKTNYLCISRHQFWQKHTSVSRISFFLFFPSIFECFMLTKFTMTDICNHILVSITSYHVHINQSLSGNLDM